MKFFVPFVIIATLIESVFYPVPLLLLVVILLALIYKEKSAGAIFFSGLLIDLFSVRVLGTSSVFFMVIYFLVCSYNKKIHLGNLYYVLTVMMIASSGYMLIFYRASISILNLLLTGFLGFALAVFVSRVFPEKIGTQIKLDI